MIVNLDNNELPSSVYMSIPECVTDYHDNMRQ